LRKCTTSADTGSGPGQRLGGGPAVSRQRSIVIYGYLNWREQGDMLLPRFPVPRWPGLRDRLHLLGATKKKVVLFTGEMSKARYASDHGA